MRVKEILDKAGAWYRIIDLGEPGKSSDQFAKQIEPDAVIAKTIVIKTDKEFNAFVILKDSLVDYKKLKNHFGTKKLRMANVEEVLQHSTSPPGACCPLLVDCPIYFDPEVLKHEKLHTGSGDVMTGLEVKTEDLIRIVKPKILDVSVHKNDS